MKHIYVLLVYTTRSEDGGGGRSKLIRSSGSFGYDELLHVAAIKEALYVEIERKGLFE